MVRKIIVFKVKMYIFPHRIIVRHEIILFVFYKGYVIKINKNRMTIIYLIQLCIDIRVKSKVGHSHMLISDLIKKL